MMKLKSILASKTLFNNRTAFRIVIWILVLCVGIIFHKKESEARLYIDITSPSMRKIAIAIPDFKYIGETNQHPDLTSKLSEIISNDFDLSGYFRPGGGEQSAHGHRQGGVRRA